MVLSKCAFSVPSMIFNGRSDSGVENGVSSSVLVAHPTDAWRCPRRQRPASIVWDGEKPRSRFGRVHAVAIA